MPGMQKAAMILILSGLSVVAPASGQSGFGQQSYGAPQGWGQPQMQQSAQPMLSPEQLQNLVAPIALYPDPLLSQVLAASTYPMELVQAQQWLRQRPGLRGPQLIDAARQTNWDPSVQALVAFPDVLALLTRDVEWTTDLGNAFLAQQSDVFNAIQQMRAAAQQSGRLTSTPQQVVSQPGGPIQIQPADPQVMYVPSYDPAYVWGPPPAGAWPALGYPSVAGVLFGAATLVGSLFTGFLTWGGWGWGLSWLSHSLLLNGLFLGHFGFGGGGYGVYARGYSAPMVWAHNPAHRLGVPYSNSFVANRFGGSYRGGFYSSHASAASSYRAPGASSWGYRGPAQNYSRSWATPSRPYASPAPSGGNSFSRGFSPQYSARGALPSNTYGSYSSPHGLNGGGQRFSAPRPSGGGHASPHSSAGHSSGGHAGGHSGGHRH